MKLSSLLLASIFSLLVASMAAQSNSLVFSLTSNQSVLSNENDLIYQMTPFQRSLLDIRGLSYSEQRISFGQKSRRSVLGMDLSLNGKLLQHTFHSGYEYLYDSSDIEENFQPYKNKTGFLGYTLDLAYADSLKISAGLQGFIRSEDDRYLLGNILNSDGYQVTAGAVAGKEFRNTQLGFNAAFDQKKLDWEYYRSSSINAYLNHNNDFFAINNLLNLNQRKDDLFVLSESDIDNGRGIYILYDKQTRNSILYSGNLSYVPTDVIQFSLQENYSQRITNLSENIVRSNSDYINQASIGVDLLPWRTFSWSSSFNHSYAIKDFNYNRNTRHTENRVLASSVSYEYTPGDTLSAGATIDLQRTTFPDDNNLWDNDLRNIKLNLSNVHYWHDRVKFSNRLFWTLTDDVYIDGVLSNNNKHNNSLIYNPECAILIGDRLLFNQTYTLRADYTDYIYATEDKSLFRQLGLEYKLVFDSYPYIARSTDLRWMLLPYRNKDKNAFMTDLSFAYERNEYGDYNGSLYVIDFKNIRYTTTLTLKYDIDDIYYILQPKYTWGTWQEYNMLIGFAWKFTNNSLMELSLNPTGDSINDLDWRTSISLSAHF